MKLPNSWGTAITFLFFASASCHANVGVAPYINCNNPNSINFVISNNYSHAIEFSDHSLPWKFSSQVFQFRGYKVGDGAPKEIGQHRIIDDNFGDMKTKLSPGELAQGEIDLSFYFGDIGDIRNDSDIIITYEINSNAAKDVLYAGRGGVIFLPRTSLFRTRCPSLLRATR